MKMESNRGISLHVQSMVQNDFPLLSHPSLLPLVSQDDKHHKELMFIAQYIFYTYITLFTHTLFQKFGICAMFVLYG